MQIARMISKEIENCSVKLITELPDDEPVGGPGKFIGFAFPVFCFGPPRIVKNFIERLKIQPGTYCFAFICYGGYGADALGMLDDILAQKGVGLSYGDGVVMPKSNASASNPEETNRIISKATVKIEKSAKEIADAVKRPIKRKAKLLSKAANRLLYKNIAKYDQKFGVTDQCTACGLCVSLCPVNNIRLDEDKPTWLHHCERCLRCLQWCPCEAIQYGKKTTAWKRYHNPSIKAKDILNNDWIYNSDNPFRG